MQSNEIVVVPTEQLKSLISESITTALKNFKQEAKPPPEPEERLLTVKEAAKFLSLSQQTIYGLMHRKELPYLKRRKLCYFVLDDLIQYLKAGRHSSNSEIEMQAENNLKNRKTSKSNLK